MRTLFLLAAGLIAAAAAPGAQAPATSEPLPSFEVAAVRVNKSGEMGANIRRQPGGRMTSTNMPLRDLIQFAYQVRPFQIEGAPDWTRSTRYDITAKAATDLPLTPPGTVAQEMLMLRSLLADRFKLAVHFETREMPIYELTLAREGGRTGPNLSVSTTDCQAMMKEAQARGGGPPAPPPGSSPDRVMCGLRIGPGRLSMGSMPIAELSNVLGGLTQRTVVNRTGLEGTYDGELMFMMEQLGGPGGVPLQLPPGAPVDPNAPSLFTALQEQFGLKLESARGPVQMLVIDRVEPAIED